MVKLICFLIIGTGLLTSIVLWIFIIVKIFKTHKESGDSIKDCISYIDSYFYMTIIGLNLALILSIFAIRVDGTEYQRTTVCNVEINNDNTLYKYKVTKYDEIEYRNKKLNGEWKENSQRVEKTRPKVIYTDDISDFDVKNK